MSMSIKTFKESKAFLFIKYRMDVITTTVHYYPLYHYGPQRFELTSLLLAFRNQITICWVEIPNPCNDVWTSVPSKLVKPMEIEGFLYHNFFSTIPSEDSNFSTKIVLNPSVFYPSSSLRWGIWTGTLVPSQVLELTLYLPKRRLLFPSQSQGDT